ncbi:DEAD/DEAH box helicase [Phytoactinopolyspora mesophila]|uniref:DEAD/DEAH box helicase n=1 Tax=Phytoactinopolyspora mesophila TaxID=2650750 RepID=UPI001C9E685A
MEAELRRCTAVFNPRVPARSGHLSFHPPDSAETLVELPLAEAVPALCWSGELPAHPTVEFWRAATFVALRLVADHRIEPHATDDGIVWSLGELDDTAESMIRDLETTAPPELGHVRAYLDAVADYLANPDMDAGVRISLRVELIDGVAGLADDTSDERFQVTVQVHSLSEPSATADAAELWERPEQFGPGARAGAMLAVRRAAGAWQPLDRLLRSKVPDRILLDDDELADLLSGGAQRLASTGTGVQWPPELANGLTATAIIPTSGPLSRLRRRTGDEAGPSSFDSTELLHMSWRIELGGSELTQAELDTLAEARRPFVRLRGQWVLVDPRLARKAEDTDPKALGAFEALGAALTGTAEIDGEQVPVAPTGWLEQLRQRIAEPESGAEPLEAPSALAATLRDYQLRGLRWLHRMTSLGLGACLADDMGLGKTITVIALHLHRQTDPATAGRTLVVCPASLLGNWEREINRFAPGTPVLRHHGSGRELAAILGETDGGFVLTTYGTMRLDTGYTARGLTTTPWQLVVADEAQHVKNADSKTARALREIPAGARVALTGTPVENNLSELWAIMDWATPGFLGSLGAFRRRWAEPIESGKEPAATAAAQRLSRLIAPFMLRRRKTDPGIAPELPPKTVTDRPVTLTAEQAALYEATVRETLAKIKNSSGIARRGLVLSLLTALKQVCNHPAQYLKEPLGAAGRSGKLDLLDDLVSTITAEEDAVLVFTQYVSMAKLIEEHFTTRGMPIQVLHGGTPVDQREAMVRRFQESAPAQAPIFVLSLKAAGTGLNLTRAGHVIHYDRWWNPAVEEQATDRAYRIGQTRPVQVHRLIAEGTVEDRIAAMLAAKRGLADSVLGAGEAALSELSDAELAELVELRPESG